MDVNLDASPETYFTPTLFGDELTWICGLIVADDDVGEFRAFGSGFLASPTLAFTARHVVDEICKELVGVDSKLDDLKGVMPFGAQLATADQFGRLVKWDIIDFHYTATIDIIGLSIERADNCEGIWPQVLPRFEVRPPRKNERIVAFGYPGTKPRELEDGSFRVKLTPLTAGGVVKELHLEGRDNFLLPFPCFRTNARMDAGMSGGPVFNESGLVCGVVCSSLEYNEGVDTVSYASVFYPALAIRFNEGRKKSADIKFLRSEAEAGRMQVSNLDWVRVDACDGSTDRVRYEDPGGRT